MKLPHSLLATFLAFAPLGHAQSVLDRRPGRLPEDLFGATVADAGDVNGDGVSDWLVGAPGSLVQGTWQPLGAVYVHSGADGRSLHAFVGAHPAAGFGHIVAAAGDVDADGFADVILGAPNEDHGNREQVGSARVYSGRDGALLHLFWGSERLAHLGEEVGNPGDVDADGHADLFLFSQGVPGETDKLEVRSGASGGVLWLRSLAHVGTAATLAAIVGDLDGDGIRDVAFTRKLVLRTFSGATGDELYEVGTPYGAWSVAEVGDVDGDAVSDFALSNPAVQGPGSCAGAVWIVSGVDGSSIRDIPCLDGLSHFGWSIAGLGDLDGDGRAEVAVGSIVYDQPGRVTVVSAFDGSVRFERSGVGAYDGFGWGLAPLRDVDGDGLTDLLVGATHDGGAEDEPGGVWVLSGARVRIGTSYCGPAVPNSTGLPGVLDAFGSATVEHQDVLLAAHDLPAGQMGMFLIAAAQGFVSNPGGSQGNLCLAGPIGRYLRAGQSSSAGVLELAISTVDLPPPFHGAMHAGETWSFQAWHRDQNPTATSNFTDGVSVLFQ